MIQHYIDGQFTPSLDGATFTVEEPATGEPLATVAAASPADVDRAVAAARRAFEEGPWSRLRAAERAIVLLDLAEILAERLDEIAVIEARDTGIPLYLTRGGHLPRAIAHLRYFAGEAERLVGECYPMDGAYLQVVTREPAGVAVVLAPWNSPLSILSMGLGPALACGDTCVLKPSELAPLSVAALADAVAQLDLPPGVVNVLHGGGEVGAALVAHPGVDVVSFTGDTATGKRVLAASAATVKRVTCELGGKSAVVVLADAEFDRAVDGSLLGIFGSNGEACMAGSRILVEQPIYRRFAEVFAERAVAVRVGDPLDAATEMGPLISRAHRGRILSAVEGARRDGAIVLTGGMVPPGCERGWYVAPTVVSDVNNHMALAREEVFGPVAALIPFEGAEEAVSIANDSSYGLAGYVWSTNAEKALDVAARLRAGSIFVNSPPVRDLRVPFGGYKQSGIGRVGGRHSIDLFSEVKTTCIPVRPYSLPRLGVMEES